MWKKGLTYFKAFQKGFVSLRTSFHNPKPSKKRIIYTAL